MMIKPMNLIWSLLNLWIECTFISVLDGAPQCKTSSDSSKNPNKVCLFPFIYEGTTYTKCTALDLGLGNIIKNVCATEYHDDGITIKSYGTCSEACEEIG